MRFLHIVICGLSVYIIFFHILIDGTFFGKRKLLNIKRVLCFSVQHLSATFLILRRTERATIKNVYRSSCKVPARQIFEKYSNFTFHENPSSVSRIVPYGRKYMLKLIFDFRIFGKLRKAPNKNGGLSLGGPGELPTAMRVQQYSN